MGLGLVKQIENASLLTKEMVMTNVILMINSDDVSRSSNHSAMISYLYMVILHSMMHGCHLGPE